MHNISRSPVPEKRRRRSLDTSDRMLIRTGPDPFNLQSTKLKSHSLDPRSRLRISHNPTHCTRVSAPEHPLRHGLARSMPLDLCLLLRFNPFCCFLFDVLLTGFTKDIDTQSRGEIHPLMPFQTLNRVECILGQFEDYPSEVRPSMLQAF